MSKRTQGQIVDVSVAPKSKKDSLAQKKWEFKWSDVEDLSNLKVTCGVYIQCYSLKHIVCILEV